MDAETAQRKLREATAGQLRTYKAAIRLLQACTPRLSSKDAEVVLQAAGNAKDGVVKLDSLVDFLFAAFGDGDNPRKAKLHEVFAALDVDTSGLLDLKECKTSALLAGQWAQEVVLEDIIKIMEADGKSVGKVTADVFVKLYSANSACMTDDMFETMATDLQVLQKKASQAKSDLNETFRVFDSDGDGFIDRADLKRTLALAGEVLSDAEIDEMLREADRDGDGVLNIEDFSYMMSAPS